MAQNTTRPAKATRAAIIFANIKGNLGDYAILGAMISAVRRKSAHCQIDIFPHPLVPIDTERLTEFERRNTSITIKPRQPRLAPKLINRLITGLFPKKNAQAILTDKYEKEIAPYAGDFRNYDWILFAGGDQWGGRDLGIHMFGTLRAISRINKNIFAFPFSLKSSTLNFHRTENLRSYYQCLGQPIIIRDTISKAVIDKTNTPAVLGADSVFGIAHEARSIPATARREPDRVIFAIKAPKKALYQAANHFLQIGLKIEMLSTCPHEDDDAYSEVARELRIPYHAPLCWEEIVAEFKSSSLVITNRLHGLILGSIAETPLLPISDRKKSLAFAIDAGIPIHTADPLSITLATIQEIQTDRATLLAKITTYRDNCAKMAVSPLDCIE